MSKNNMKETFSESVFAMILSEVVIKSLGLIYKLYITNKPGFGDEGNAISQGAFQVFALMLSFTAIGIPNAISKLVAERSSIGDHKGAFRIFKVSLVIFSVIGMLGTYFLIVFAKRLSTNYLHIAESELSILTLAPSIFLTSVISVFRGYFIGRKSIKITGKAQARDQIAKTFSTIIMIELSIFILKKSDTEIMAALNNLALTIGNIFEAATLLNQFIKEYPDIKYEVNNSINTEKISAKRIAVNVLSMSIPLSLTAIILTISKNIDSISIVSKLKNIIGYEEAKKQYGILSGKADALVNFPLSFNVAISSAILPAIASAKGNYDSQRGKVEKTLQFELALFLPVMFTYIFFGDQLLHFLFPNAPDGATILKINSLQIMIVCIEQMSNTILNGMGKTKAIIKAVLIGTLVKIALNYILISKTNLFIGGTNGAALATTVCHIIICILTTKEVLKDIKISPFVLIKPLAINVVFVALSEITYNLIEVHVSSAVSLICSLAVGGIAYGILVIALGIIKVSQIANLIKIRKN